MSNFLPVWHVLPVHPARHAQVLGRVQVPPFVQDGLQTAVQVFRVVITGNAWDQEIFMSIVLDTMELTKLCDCVSV